MPNGHFHWDEDREISEIVITGEAPLDMEVVGKRPAITVVLGPVQYQGLGIDNMLSYQMSTGKRVRTDLMAGHFVVYCLADNDTLAQRLGHVVAHHTRVHQRILESKGGFHQIARPAPSINSPSPPGSLVMGDPLGLVMVQVNIPFQMQWTWSTLPTAPPQDRSIDYITSEGGASEYPYSSLSSLEKVKLAMSTEPVTVRYLNGANSTNAKVIQVTKEIEDFQQVEIAVGIDE